MHPLEYSKMLLGTKAINNYRPPHQLIDEKEKLYSELFIIFMHCAGLY